MWLLRRKFRQKEGVGKKIKERKSYPAGEKGCGEFRAIERSFFSFVYYDFDRRSF
jgi:hypothetical protein